MRRFMPLGSAQLPLWLLLCLGHKVTKSQVSRNASFAAHALSCKAGKTSGYADFAPLRTHLSRASAKPSDAPPNAQASSFTVFHPEAARLTAWDSTTNSLKLGKSKKGVGLSGCAAGSMALGRWQRSA